VTKGCLHKKSDTPTTLGGLQADNLVRPVYSEASGLANGTMIIPTVSGSILINGITNQDNKNGK